MTVWPLLSDAMSRFIETMQTRTAQVEGTSSSSKRTAIAEEVPHSVQEIVSEDGGVVAYKSNDKSYKISRGEYDSVDAFLYCLHWTRSLATCFNKVREKDGEGFDTADVVEDEVECCRNEKECFLQFVGAGEGYLRCFNFRGTNVLLYRTRIDSDAMKTPLRVLRIDCKVITLYAGESFPYHACEGTWKMVEVEDNMNVWNSLNNVESFIKHSK